VGMVLIHDATDLSDIETSTYDFVFSSHCLEHIANPLKAVSEWKRVVKPNGYIIIIVPNKSYCFDHKRAYTKFPVLLQQYQTGVGEDDLSTLSEILEKHDLSMDPAAGNLSQFTERSLRNFQNRCLHHYVYSPTLLTEIANFFDCEVVYTITRNLDIWFIMKNSTSVLNPQL